MGNKKLVRETNNDYKKGKKSYHPWNKSRLHRGQNFRPQNKSMHGKQKLVRGINNDYREGIKNYHLWNKSRL
jgi:hypothetical protein